MSFLPADFGHFISPGCSRYDFICARLKANNIDSSTVILEGKKNIYINFPQRAYTPLFRIKTLLVHYDRADNTPGANDNSAAVFQVLDFVERLYGSQNTHNMRIFFTDGEELGKEDGVSAQGAFAIAGRFKKLGITHDDVFVFDGCGRGSVVVISTAGKNTPGNTEFKKRFGELYQQAVCIAASVSPDNWITLPVPYSDNAGFIASGIPAAAVTVLPQNEATDIMLRLHSDPALEQRVLSRRLLAGEENILPLTWRLMHTPADTEATLNPEAFSVMARYLDALARLKTPQ